MISIDYPCCNCKHIRPNIDGWKCACEAYPNGIPKEVWMYKKTYELRECNNGFGYEPIEDRPDIQ